MSNRMKKICLWTVLWSFFLSLSLLHAKQTAQSHEDTLTLSTESENTEPAKEGALAISTMPEEVEVYIDGELKTNSTPLVLRLPVGKHQVEIKKTGKQSVSLEVIMVDGGIISKKITLADLPQPPLPASIDDMLHPKRDAFETTTEFQERRQTLLDGFNQAVQQNDPRYQAGTAYLKKDSYNIETGKFPMRLEWQATWLKEFYLPEKGHLTAVRDDARLLWSEGEQKSLYVSVELQEEILIIKQILLLGLEKTWEINIYQHLPTMLYTDWQGDNEIISAAAFSHDLSIFAAGTGEFIKLWNVGTGKQLHILSGHRSGISALAFSPNGKTLVSGGLDNRIKRWEVSTGRLLSTLKAGLLFGEGHRGHVNVVALSPDGNILVSGGADNTIKVWKVNTGEVLHTLTGHKDEVTAVAITIREDGLLLIASGSEDKTIKLWLENVPVYTFNEHKESIQTLVFSPDGKFLASGSRDKTVKIWQIHPCRPPTTLPKHDYEVDSLAFSPDSRLLVSGTSYEIKLWEVRSGDLLYRLTEGVDSFVGKTVIFSPDGRILASGGELNTVRLWGPSD
jgi:WD40 repeat protein